MKTPIIDFVKRYNESGISRLHMPGHKGKAFLGFEPLDITEINGADVLYSAKGIIKESENNASRLFNSAHTFYSAEGSTLAIKAMLGIAVYGINGRKPRILAARNVHKAFIYACALLDLEVIWLYDADTSHLCSGNITPDMVKTALNGQIDAVYVTSPDYLGCMLDIKGISEVCKAHNVPLLVDNAHGAYLKFLTPSRHPLDLGADMCCDSAHKTLPAITGAAYLHIAKKAEHYVQYAPKMLSLFASTSPSYLVLQSLDMCNDYISSGYTAALKECCERVGEFNSFLTEKGIALYGDEPLKVCINAKICGVTGEYLAELLQKANIEPEFYDNEFLVLMFTPENSQTDFERLYTALKGFVPQKSLFNTPSGTDLPEVCMSIRSALLSVSETLPIEEAVGRICASPTVSCPPAVPVIMSGERITDRTVEMFKRYGINKVDVVK